jgi:GNAT superfamily N-acetyltransferase
VVSQADASSDEDVPNGGTPAVQLRRLDPAQLERRFDDVMRVYRRAFLDVHERDPARAEAERAAHARTHLRRPGLRAVAAFAGPAGDSGGRHREVDTSAPLVGIAYGQPGAPGQWWHDTVAAAVAPDLAATWLADCFEVVELHVLPEYQGRGLGRRLLRMLLDGVPQSTAALSALEEPDSPARRLYAAEGFQPLLSNFHFAGGPTPYAVLVKRLP